MRISLNVVESPNGVILYRGPSLLNGRPIVVVATGLKAGSDNEKTGAMVQIYILSDESERPTDALKSGADESICGDCIHRQVDGWGTCYVNAGQGPNAIYQALQKGRYPVATEEMVARLFKGRNVRFGAYGDPAAVPLAVWQPIVKVAKGRTGYTHQWRRIDGAYREFLMASVETRAQQVRARAMGWKTFRVRNEDEPIGEHEFICPASAEAGKKLTCEECLACKGGVWNGRTVTPVIAIHGGGTSKYKERRFAKMQKRMRQKKAYRTLLPI